MLCSSESNLLAHILYESELDLINSILLKRAKTCFNQYKSSDALDDFLCCSKRTWIHEITETKLNVDFLEHVTCYAGSGRWWSTSCLPLFGQTDTTTIRQNLKQTAMFWYRHSIYSFQGHQTTHDLVKVISTYYAGIEESFNIKNYTYPL